MVIGALIGAFVGSSIGIAGFGGAIAGTIPIAILCGYIGYRVGMGMMRRVMVSFLYCPVRISNSRFLNNAFAASISYLIGKPKWALRPSVVRAKGSFKDTRI